MVVCGMVVIPLATQHPTYVLVSDSCLTCEEAAKPDPTKYRPKLWRLKPTETFDSKHPLKSCSYKETKDALNDSIQSSAYVGNLTVISECAVLKFWSKPITDFLDYFNLPIHKNTLPNQTFQSYFVHAVSLNFPLLSPSRKIMQSVLTAMKAGTFCGFALVGNS